MNKLEYYDRQKDSWKDTEIEEIRDAYQNKEMTVSEIADIHRRTPGSISYKLQNMGLITHNTLSRGYSDYKNSDLYKEIVKNSVSMNAQRSANKELRIKSRKEAARVNTPFREILELKNEVSILRNDVKEMLRLMNALYEFETK